MKGLILKEYGLANLRKFNFRLAQQKLEGALKYIKNDDVLYTYLSELYTNIRDLDKGIISARNALKINRNNIAAYNLLGKIFQVKGDLRESIKNYFKLIEYNPDDDVIRGSIANMYLILKQPDEAIAHYDYIIQLKPKSEFAITAKNNIIRAYIIKGDFQKGIKIGEELLNSNDATDLTYYNLGQAYYSFGQLEKAQKIADAGIKAGSKYAPLFDLKGEIFNLKGDLKNAIQYYKRAVELDP